jgi:hypothetical protein
MASNPLFPQKTLLLFALKQPGVATPATSVRLTLPNEYS